MKEKEERSKMRRGGDIKEDGSEVNEREEWRKRRKGENKEDGNGMKEKEEGMKTSRIEDDVQDKDEMKKERRKENDKKKEGAINYEVGRRRDGETDSKMKKGEDVNTRQYKTQFFLTQHQESPETQHVCLREFVLSSRYSQVGLRPRP